MEFRRAKKGNDIIAYKITKKYQPETVMVALPIRLVQWRAEEVALTQEESCALRRIEFEACRKALEKEKLL